MDGHNWGDIDATLRRAMAVAGQPAMVIAHTIKGKGVSFAENTYLWHSNNVNDEIYARALAELGEP
jgi:transketolase